MASSSNSFSPRRHKHSKCRENIGDSGRSKFTRDPKSLISKSRRRRARSSIKLSSRRRPSYISRLSATVSEQNEMSYLERSEGNIRQRERMSNRRAQDEQLRHERIFLAQLAHERDLQRQMMEHEERMATLASADKREEVLDEKEELERRDRNFYVTQFAAQDAFVNGYGVHPANFSPMVTGFANGHRGFHAPPISAMATSGPGMVYGGGRLGFVGTGDMRAYGNGFYEKSGLNDGHGYRNGHDGEFREAGDCEENDEDKMDLDDDDEDGEEN